MLNNILSCKNNLFSRNYGWATMTKTFLLFVIFGAPYWKIYIWPLKTAFPLSESENRTKKTRVLEKNLCFDFFFADVIKNNDIINTFMTNLCFLHGKEYVCPPIRVSY